MKPLKRLAPWLLLFVLGACQQPTADPDEALRKLLVSTTWITDETAVPAETLHFSAYFSSDGSGKISGGPGSWTIKDGTMTLTTSEGTQIDVTPSGTFLVTGGQLTLNYLGATCHLVPLGS